jgi:hypothetical protein
MDQVKAEDVSYQNNSKHSQKQSSVSPSWFKKALETDRSAESEKSTTDQKAVIAAKLAALSQRNKKIETGKQR